MQTIPIARSAPNMVLLPHLSVKEGLQKRKNFEKFSEMNLAAKEPLDLREALELKNNIILWIK